MAHPPPDSEGPPPGGAHGSAGAAARASRQPLRGGRERPSAPAGSAGVRRQGERQGPAPDPGRLSRLAL